MRAGNIKWERVTTRLIVVVISFAAATVIVWATVRNSFESRSQGAVNETKAKSVEQLDGQRKKYATIRSVHIVADAQIAVFGANFRVGNGSYEYWAEGDLYKMKCHTDRNLGFLTDVDVSYDGKQFYFFDRASGILSYQQQDVTKTTGALPNPLFMPIDFLSIDDDDCHFCALRMSDLKSPSARWEDRASRIEVKSQGRDATAGYPVTNLEMPGGIKGKQAFKFGVRMADTGNGEVRITRIDRVGLDGKLLTSTTFDHFAASGLGEFPRTISLEGFDADSNRIARMTYTIKTLDVNQPIEKSFFAIGFDEAEGVWDSDGRRFVKEKQPKPMRP